MSVINKILGKLKKQELGAEEAVKPSIRLDDAMKKRLMAAGLGVVLLGAAGAGWMWWSGRQQAAHPPAVAQTPAKHIASPQPHPLPAAQQPSAASEVAPAHELVTPQSAVASEQLAAAEHEPVQEHVPAEATAHKEVAQEHAPPVKAEPKQVARHEVMPSQEQAQPAPKKTAPSKEPAKNEVVAGQATPGKSAKQDEHEAKSEALATAPALPEAHPEAAPAKPSVAESRRKQRKPVAPKAEKAAEAPAGGDGVDKQVKPLTEKQQAENEYRKASSLVQQGRYGEALERYESSLKLDPAHDAARRAMVGVLLQGKRTGEAEQVLQDGLRLNVRNSDFAMLLARIQLDRDAAWSALLTLQKTLPHAEQRADYRAFVAALLQRLERNKEAVTHYQAALQLSPDSGVWWMGLGISLRALQRDEEAKDAFRHALESGTLNADLQAFVERQIRDL